MSTLTTHTHKLSSGLTVVITPLESMKSVTAIVYVNTGSRYENPKVAGISHFLEHMVFKGTAKYKTAQDLAVAVDAVGAEINAFTSKEYTGYYVKAASTQLPLALDVLSEMMLAPNLKQEDIDREKNVIVEEINMYNDTPMRHIGDIFEQVMFADSALGNDIIGLKETVRAIDTAAFEAYVQEWYGLGNMVLSLAGDASVLNNPNVLKSIEQAFGKKTKSARKNGGERALATKQLGISKQLRVKVEYKKTDQAHFIMAIPGLLRADKRKYELSVLATIFGGAMSSRLFTEVREKRGLCYYVRCEMDVFHDAGYFGAAAGVDPARIDEAVSVVKEELFALASNGEKKITQEEVRRAKDHILGKMSLDLEDTEGIAQWVGSKQLLLGEVENYDEVLRRIEAVTLEEVVQLAKDLLASGGITFALIGPYKDEARFTKLLA